MYAVMARRERSWLSSDTRKKREKLPENVQLPTARNVVYDAVCKPVTASLSNKESVCLLNPARLDLSNTARAIDMVVSITALVHNDAASPVPKLTQPKLYSSLMWPCSKANISTAEKERRCKGKREVTNGEARRGDQYTADEAEEDD